MRLIFIFCFSLLLNACSNFQPVALTNETKIDIPIRDPTPITLKPVKWKIIQSNDVIYIALTTQEYENLSYDLLQLRKLIEEQKLILKSIKEFQTEQNL